MPTTLHIISLNIEGSRHLELVLPFLEQQRPDVVCLQELPEKEIDRIEKTLGASCFFTPQTLHESGVLGVGIFTSLLSSNKASIRYGGVEGNIRLFDNLSEETNRATQKFSVTFCDVIKNSTQFTIATTHFTWTQDGKANDSQREDLQQMLEILNTRKPHVLCGDFNAPRGREIFTELSKHYKDNVPLHYTTSLDKNLHRAGDLQYMVDGMFSTPEYSVSNVELVFGVSDHAAVVATVEKATV